MPHMESQISLLPQFVPYIMIKTVNFSDETVKRKSLQDLGVYLKYRALEKDFGSWNLSLSPAIGFTTPITDYATDFYAVGQGCYRPGHSVALLWSLQTWEFW